MSRRSRILIAVSACTAFVFVGLAPFALMLVPNPKPVAVSDIARQMPGNFIASGGQTYHVFPSAERVSALPEDALATGPDAVFIVKYRQLSSLDAYTMWTFGRDTQVPVERDLSTPHLLKLKPSSPLEAGGYYVVVPRESIYGGEDYVYFAVADKAASQ